MKKKLPHLDVFPENLFEHIYAPVKWELLKTAIELRLFDQTREARTADAVAGALSIHPANTEYLLNALVALGCLEKSDGRFVNTRQAERYLTTGQDTSVGDTLLFMAQWTAPLMQGGVAQLVKQGPPPPMNSADPELWAHGARASLNYSRSGRAQMIARQVALLPEYASFSKILDMGCGPGIMGITVTAAHPSVSCVLMDQPAVATVCEEVVAEYGLEGRVRVCPGDYMTDGLGDGYDFIMANMTLNFYRDRLDVVMKKVLAALTPGGVFMVHSDGLSKDGTAPAASVISWISSMLQGQDLSMEEGRIAQAMLDAGFVSTQRVLVDDATSRAHGPVEMTIGRART